MYKVYIAGKITGDKDYKKKFDRAAAEIAADGHIVLNPAILPGGMEYADYMRVCFAMIDCADRIYFLKDYHESKGAMLEYQHSKYIGKKMWFEGCCKQKHAGLGG